MIEPVVRKLLQRYWRISRGLTLGARGIVVDSGGRVLLVRHTYRPGWTFPGGGVEYGETIECALARELVEEAGVTITGHVELFGIYSNHAFFPGDHVAIYLVRHWTQTPPRLPNREIAELGFFAPATMPEGTSPGARRRVEEMLGLRARQAEW